MIYKRQNIFAYVFLLEHIILTNKLAVNILDSLWVV
jgi:hypothetical protein